MPWMGAFGSTIGHHKVHSKLNHGFQGIRCIAPHHREAACFMGPHSYRPVFREDTVRWCLAGSPHDRCSTPPMGVPDNVSAA